MTVPAIWPLSTCANATLPQTEATTKRPKTATVRLRKILRAEKPENLDRDCNENDVIELLQSRSEMRNLSKKSFTIQVRRFRGLDGEGKSDSADSSIPKKV